MSQNTEITDRLIEIIEPICIDSGYELVDVDFARERAGWVMRVYIDRSGGIGFADCESVSRELSAVLDVEDPVAQAYNLEVSSPGVERPLRTFEHFQSHLGQTAKVSLGDGLEGRRNFKGTLVDAELDSDSERARIAIDVDGKTYQLPLADVVKAHLVPDWDAVLKQSKRQSGAVS